jgi:hypothetical protein
MNKRILFTFLVVLLVGLGLWALFRKKPESSTPSTSVETQNQPTEQPPPQARPGSPNNTPSPVTTAPRRSQARTAGNTVVEGVPVSEEVLRYIENVKADPDYDWKQPINFYGRVVDENNQPVAGATAGFEWTDLSQKGTSKATAISDETGFFSLTDRQGKRLVVDVAKDGYYSGGNSRNAAFEYANPGDGLFTPDSANPVVFHLRKKGEAAQLIHGLKLFGSRVDGTLSYVDLTTAKNGRTPPGDLTVQCTRSERNADKKFDWTFTLGVPGGGLIKSTDEFMFLAPDSGYQPTFQISHRINDPDWTGQEKHKFFIKSQDGRHYARIEITIMPDYNQNAAYDVEWFLNPNGSPNLESAPDKTTNVQ